jgi:hypothetical protein
VISRCCVVLVASLLLSTVSMVSFAEDAKEISRHSVATNGVDIEKTPIEDLVKLPPEQLSAVIKQIDSRLKELASAASKSLADSVELRRDVRRTNESVRAILTQIDVLKEKIERTIDESPEIKACHDATEKSKNAMLDLGKKRQKLLLVVSDMKSNDAGPSAKSEEAGKAR